MHTSLPLFKVLEFVQLSENTITADLALDYNVPFAHANNTERYFFRDWAGNQRGRTEHLSNVVGHHGCWAAIREWRCMLWKCNRNIIFPQEKT